MSFVRRSLETILPEHIDGYGYRHWSELSNRQRAAAFRGPYGLSKLAGFTGVPLANDPSREYVRITHTQVATGERIVWGDYNALDKLENRRPPETFPAGTAEQLMNPDVFERVVATERAARIAKALVITGVALAIAHLHTDR